MHTPDSRTVSRRPPGAARLRDGAHAPLPRAHRALRRRAERVHHGDRPSKRSRSRRGRPSASRTATATPLTGIPLAHKDIFCTAGVKTSCGSRMLDNFVAPYDATVVERLQSAGAVMLGKTNMDEFAMGSSNETSFYGPVRNPWDHALVPGGSSGGSAAAVAARIAPAATGTDTGGSIRQPAALSGITGFKPTYGRVSRYGMIAFASSLDQAGVLTQTAEDAALLLEAMAGFDARDSTSLDEPVPRYSQIVDEPLGGRDDRRARELLRRRARCRQCDGAARGARGAREARREAEEHRARRTSTCRCPRTTSSRRPKRRRTCRASTACASATAPPQVSTGAPRDDLLDVLHAQPRRRLRRRGEAPHPHRHVRALGRLLRRVLPAGAEGAQAHQRRLRARVPRRRRRRGADDAVAGVRDRAKRRATRSRCT